MDVDGPDESFNIEFTDPEYARTATTIDLNEDPEGEDVEVCSAEPPSEKLAPKKTRQGAAAAPVPVAEKTKKRTSLPTAGEDAASLGVAAPKRSQRRMEAQAKAKAAAAAAVPLQRQIQKKEKKRGPKPRTAPVSAPKATPSTPPEKKKVKREQRLLAIREAAEKATAAGSLTPPAPPSPLAKDFVDEEIIRSAEKEKKQLEKAKLLAAEKAITKDTTAKKQKKKRGRSAAKAPAEENGDNNEEEEEQQQIEEAGPSSQQKNTTRRKKRSRGETPLPPPTTAAEVEEAQKAATEAQQPDVVTPPADLLEDGPNMDSIHHGEEPDSNQEIAETAAAVDLSAPSSALTTTDTAAAGDADQYANRNPTCAARDWIMAALANPRGKEAASAFLRESLENSVETIVSNIESTISEGQNNSLLVLGGRGAGKTLAVERALTAVTTQWNTDSADPLVGIVRLVGWAHADERTAFKEIARQLCGTFQLQFSRKASLGDNIEFLRHVLDGLARAHKVAVFVLDDFDLFARRAKQTLLYCLLDALQTSGVQAVVLGTTERHDCVDLLEKRVKSRFSHRSIQIEPPRGAQTIEPSTAAASPGSAAAMTSPGGGVDELPKEGSLEILRKMLTLPGTFPYKPHAKAHNTAVKAAVSHKDVIKALGEFVTYRTSLHDLKNVAQATIAASSTHPKGLITHEAIVQACTNLEKALDQGTVGYVAGLSVLELAVLVGAHRAAGRVDGDAINFEMTFKEFYTYSTSGDHVDNYTKGAACKAFFKLAEMGLISPSTGKADARIVSGNHFAPMYVQVTASELRSGIDEHQKCPAKLKDWATREGGPLTTAAAILD